MPVATPPLAVPSRSPSLVKMEERKRPPPISNADDLAPPSKRQHLNGGGGKSKDDGGDTKDEAWIEDYQKDAILRRMQELKREAVTLDTRLKERERQSVHHDDHIRIIDAWILQILQEIELLCEGTVTTEPSSKDFPYPSALRITDAHDFEKHLGKKAKDIKARVQSLFDRLAACRGEIKLDVVELETQLKSMLASQKDHIIRLDRLNSEKEALSEQLDIATLRYIKAEKKLDRAKSAQVQKLEQQALANATARPLVAGTENGVAAPETLEQLDALRVQVQEAEAVAEKQKEQLETAFAEVKGLQEENSSIKSKKDTLSEEEYSRTEVFKLFRNQNEDLIKRINHLEATNKQLREEAEKLQAERSAFRAQLEAEAQALTGDLEDQVQAKEQDLTRIRSARDELLADVQIRKASQDQERAALNHIQELLSATEDRAAALEQEVARLRPQEDVSTGTSRPDLESLSVDELREKCAKLEKDFASIQSEVPSIEKAYKKAIGLAQKKVMDFAALEERVAVLTLEKGKADQKYFAARKDADIRNGEIRQLRMQNGKSSEIIASLKDMEAQNRTLLTNLEKQLADFRSSNAAIFEESRTLKTSTADATRRADSTNTLVADLTALVKSKDAAQAVIKEHAAAQETEAQKLRVKLEHAQRDRDSWKAKCHADSSEEEEMLRNLALCSICRKDFKNTILKQCGHLFCHGCIETRYSSRMRKCPTCSKPFDKNDIMAAHL